MPDPMPDRPTCSPSAGHHPPPAEASALETVGLGRRYRRGWALRDCSFRLPAGRVCALVGPNGAGKSTLLSLAADLLEPSTGTVRLFGHAPGTVAARRGTAFLSQDKPLHRTFRVHEILRLGRELNPGWDQGAAERILAQGAIPLTARVGSLSGGQRTRVAFALAFGKRPQLLLLDEPMADLDPLVRHQMMGLLTAEAAEHGTTVVLSSHMVSELEGACDFLVLVNEGTVRLAGEVDRIVSAHRLLRATDPETATRAATAGHVVVEARPFPGTAGSTLLIRPRGTLDAAWDRYAPTPPSLEELVLAHLRAPDAPALITPSAAPYEEDAA